MGTNRRVQLISALMSMLVVLLSGASAQHGDARNPGNLPPGFMGDTWTGEITAVSPETREITLTAATKKGNETFVAYLPEHFTQPESGKDAEVQMTDFGIGQHIRVYYISKNPKINGHKVKRNEIVRIESVSGDKH